jgi:hypothetical protein
MKKINWLLGVTVVLVGMSSCMKNKNDTPSTPVAGLMAFNLAADKNQVGFDIGGNVFTRQPLNFLSYTGAYNGVFTGTRTLTAFDFGTNSSIASANNNYEDGNYYSAFLIGTNNNYRNLVVADNLDSLEVVAGKAYIRYINAIPDSAAPTVTVIANDVPVNSGILSYGRISDFVAVNTGNLTITTTNGTNINTNRIFPVTEKKIYTILLAGNPASANADSVQTRYIENGTLQ